MQRYNLGRHCPSGVCYVDESDDGDWVRWDDVQQIIEAATELARTATEGLRGECRRYGEERDQRAAKLVEAEIDAVMERIEWTHQQRQGARILLTRLAEQIRSGDDE